MKKLLFIFLISVFSSCSVSDGHLVIKIEYFDDNRDLIKTNYGGFIYVPHGLYAIGDTIHFCK